MRFKYGSGGSAQDPDKSSTVAQSDQAPRSGRLFYSRGDLGLNAEARGLAISPGSPSVEGGYFFLPVQRHTAPVIQHRERLLRDASANDLGSCVSAALRPDIELLHRLCRREVELARFLGQAALGVHGPAAAEPAKRADNECVSALSRLLRHAVPDLRSSELLARLRMMRTSIAAAFAAAAGAAVPGSVGAEPVEEAVGRIATVWVGALSAPPSRKPDGRKRKKKPASTTR